MITLRPYQEEAVAAVEQQWTSGVDKTLLVMATGCGKTIVFSTIVRNAVADGKRCLILAHRGELLEQAADKLYKSYGLRCALEKAESSALNQWERVTIGSVQSLQNEKRLHQFKHDYYDIVIIDEAHHAISESYQRILQHFHTAKVLGVTATPDRGDQRNLGRYFETLAYDYGIAKGIREGYLTPIKALQIPLEINMKGVAMQNGDYQASAVGHAIEPYLNAIAEAMKIHCKNKKTVVFLPLVATSQKFVDILTEHGFRAREVNGESKDREQILSDFEKGKIDVLCNAMLLTEGWDCPSVEVLIVLRPTKMRALYTQMVGRGTRLFQGKDKLLLLDFLWLTDKNDLCHPASLIAQDQEVVQKTAENAEKTPGVEIDIEEAVEQAKLDVINEREDKLAREIEQNRRKRAKMVDPLEYAILINAEELVNYVPAFGWEAAQPSEEQKKVVEAFGVNPDVLTSFGQAKRIIETLEGRTDEGFATPKQIRMLEKVGFRRVGTWKKQDAQRLIGRMAKNRWRVPIGINPAHYAPEKR